MNPRTPPPWLIDGIGRVRAMLGLVHRSTVPANVALFEVTQGAWLTQALYVATKLRIADELASGPQHAEEVARRVGSDPGATYRLMRALAGHGVLKLRRDGRFALAPIGKALRWDAEGSMAPMIAMVGSPEHWEHWGHLLDAVKTGDTAAENVRGMPMFDYLETNPGYAKTFNDAMTGVSMLAIQTAVPEYDFTDRQLIIDVGGGHGALLAAVMQSAPQARGVLFDLPSVVEGAASVLEPAGVAARCRVTGGSFFESVPEGGDAYLLKAIIHDWADETALSILSHVREAMASDGKLLLFELVLPEGARPHLGLLLDLEMLIHVGGRERTASEYAELLSRAGFRQTQVIPTAGPMSIVEAVPV